MKKIAARRLAKRASQGAASAAELPVAPATESPAAAQNLSGLFGVANIEKVFGLCEQVLERRWSVSDIGTPYRWINYWDRERLLMEIEREGTSWRKFSFIDYVWVRIVCELRAFGLSFAAIRRVKATLDAPLPVEPELTLRKTKERSAYNVLLLLIAEAVVTKAPIHLLIRSDGDTLLLNESQATLYGPELDRFRAAPHLCVPLTGMLGEIIRRNEIDFIAPKIPLLSAPEIEVLKLLREGQLTLLEAASPTGETVSIVTHASPNAAEAERALIESMMLRPYRQIRYETKDGKTVVFRAPAKDGES